MKLSITNSFGISMVLWLFQLLASPVACHGCDKAGQDRADGIRFQYPHCASKGKRVVRGTIVGGSHVTTSVEFVAPPWNVDHYDCSASDYYKTEACCKMPNPRFILPLEYALKLCTRPDGHPLIIK
ncbi:hypothetical protein PGT21_036748 [Puccinia graminis f. sp. tritici]|uniref:Secreted protein n=2 Tax=Puccinia graminis f. sp. tritici TaxID=56615 RepID=E3L3B1_PUCGT|nr:uncharacterized protein PGTG_17308 [Puccinia graminis f. sp. tritici CRL 75-36-700-3]EFP91036.1 hypothetical protein PGTG_17308 [Puccinia graminis f. sp. tritici CRL 75-36-700-3]KAA1119989.1 hypothetical protein PGT21_036748 [Puccinia graminis f. sp. tritici]